MEANKILVAVKIFDPKEKFTEQIKTTMPKNYMRELGSISSELKVARRYLIWDAVGNYIRLYRQNV